MALWHHGQTTILEGCLRKRKPNGEHLRLVGFIDNHPQILVPCYVPSEARSDFIIEQVFGDLNPGVLNGI